MGVAIAVVGGVVALVIIAVGLLVIAEVRSAARRIEDRLGGEAAELAMTLDNLTANVNILGGAVADIRRSAGPIYRGPSDNGRTTELSAFEGDVGGSGYPDGSGRRPFPEPRRGPDQHSRRA